MHYSCSVTMVVGGSLPSYYLVALAAEVTNRAWQMRYGNTCDTRGARWRTSRIHYGRRLMDGIHVRRANFRRKWIPTTNMADCARRHIADNKWTKLRSLINGNNNGKSKPVNNADCFGFLFHSCSKKWMNDFSILISISVHEQPLNIFFSFLQT